MMDAVERTQLAEAVRDAIAGADADGGTALDPVLAGLGWLEMLRAEPGDAVDIVFGALGRANGAATVLDDVVVSALGSEPRADLAVLLPPFATWHPPGTIDGEHVAAVGIATARVTTATDVLVVCRSEAALCTATVPASALTVNAVHGIDPDAGYHAVSLEHDGTGTPLDVLGWDAAIACGRVAVAQQIAGASHAMLDLARAHAVERVQFDRPIARFQAVRHRLADALVAVEALDAALSASRDVPNSVTAALAKAVAGRTARTVASHCQQVLAGIGFTTDHPLHRFLKRTMALDGFLGSADEIAVDLGRQLLETRNVPTLIEL